METHILDACREERGTALVALLLIISALTILSMGLMTFSSTEIQIADNQQSHTDALYTAEAGIAEVMHRMNQRPGASTVNVNGASFDPAIGDDPLNPDPNWRTEVYLSPGASLPAPVGTETVVATVQPSSSWLHYGDTGAGLEPITVEHKWADVDGDGVKEAGEIVLYDAGQFPPENLVSGFPVEVVTVPGMVDGSRRSIHTELIRLPVTARTTAAISSDNGVELTGNMSGCGHNHDVSIPVGTKIPGCYPFEQCNFRVMDQTAGCLTAVMTTGDIAISGGSSDLEGYTTWSDTSSTNPFYEVWEYLGISEEAWNDVKSHPDYTSANDAVNMDGIVVVSGDATNSEKFNTNDGYGLIYVDGDMDITGNFTWRGFIFVEGDLRVTGTAWILGAIAARGSTTRTSFAAGTSTVLFSRDAINLYVGRRVGFQTLAWNEL